MDNSHKQNNFRGVTYYLNTQEVTLRGGLKQRIYYFSKDYRAATACAMPEGYAVVENPRNGFLTLKRNR